MFISQGASGLTNQRIEIGDSPSADAFGRIRSSDPVPLFDSKLLYDKQPLWWSESIAGTGTSAHVSTGAHVLMSVTTTGDSVVRQTRQSFAYEPGKSYLGTYSFCFDSIVANTRKRVGSFDANNGIFLQHDGTTAALVVRSNGSDTVIPQASWTKDSLDGEGDSRTTVDWTKAQIFWIDFQWLGAGRIRFGFDFGGVSYVVHEKMHSNIVTTPYLLSPNLPIRYEITSTGGASSMKHICSSILSEGGVREHTGVVRGITTPTFVNSAGSTLVMRALLGIRLKSTTPNAVVHVNGFELVLDDPGFGQGALIFGPTYTATPTWTSITDSPIEFAVGTDADTYNVTASEHVMATTWFSSRVASSVDNSGTALGLGRNLSGAMTEIWVCGAAVANNKNLYASMSVEEYI